MADVIRIHPWVQIPGRDGDPTFSPARGSGDAAVGELAAEIELMKQPGTTRQDVFAALVARGYSRSTAMRRAASIERAVKEDDLSVLRPKGRECHGPQEWHALARTLAAQETRDHRRTRRITDALRSAGHDVCIDQVRYFLNRNYL